MHILYVIVLLVVCMYISYITHIYKLNKYLKDRERENKCDSKLLCDSEIHDLCKGPDSMIKPFLKSNVSKNLNNACVSYGCSSFGYDIRCSDEFKICKKPFVYIKDFIDPKDFCENNFISVKKDYCIIPSHSFVLACSLEKFKIPNNVLGVCYGKSTYARCGIIVNVTPLEPGWEGYLTLELSNTTSLPVKVYANEGIAQIMFFSSKKFPDISYKDRKGKYQNQVGITFPSC